MRIAFKEILYPCFLIHFVCPTAGWRRDMGEVMAVFRIYSSNADIKVLTRLLGEDQASRDSGLTDEPVRIEIMGDGDCVVTYQKYRVIDSGAVKKALEGLI